MSGKVSKAKRACMIPKTENINLSKSGGEYNITKTYNTNKYVTT